MLLERAEELFVYDGVNLLWKVNKGRAYKGDLAGSINGGGYREVKVDGSTKRVHRLVWLLSTGCMPTNDVDHINGVKLDNRLCNLRDVSIRTNSRNKKMPSTNTSGFVGVSLHSSGKWAARIGNNHIGLYSKIESAVAARAEVQERVGYHTNHGRNE